MPFADELDLMPDSALADLAREERRRALRGDRSAFGQAHLLERELRRRAGMPSNFGATLDAAPVATRRWWQFLSRQAIDFSA